MKRVYVNCNAAQGGNGSFDTPFISVCEAKEYVKNISGDEDITVYIMGGRYRFEDTLRFNQSDRKCTYKSYNGEKVYFDGGVVIDNHRVRKTTDENVLERIINEYSRDNVYEIDLSYLNLELGEYGDRGFRRPYIPAPNELFINSKPFKITEYPKDSYIQITKVLDSGSIPRQGDFTVKGGVIGFDTDRGKKWEKADDAYISGFFGTCYSDDTLKIEKIDSENKTIKTVLPSTNGFTAVSEHRWKIINLLEELSEPGEYYTDRKNKKLYFIPEDNIENAMIQLSVLETPILSFINASGITFDGIIFENSRGSGVYIEGGESVSITNSVFRNLGIVAVQIGQGTTSLPHGMTNCHGGYDHEKIKIHPVSEKIGSWHEYIYEYAAFDGNGGKNHLISYCDIYNIGAGGVLLGGGDRKKLVPANNMVSNTHIRNVNRLDLTYKGAVNIWGVGNVISHCELEDLDGFAVYIHGNDHLIEYTRIHNVANAISDGAAIYMGRDPSEVGNKIKYNFIYDIKNPHSYDMYGFSAIYFDDNAIYNEVYGNYFYDVVQKGRFFFSLIHWNNGGMTTVANNIVIDCYPGLDPNSYDTGYKRMHEDELFVQRITAADDDMRGVDITSDIWRKKYPYLYDTYTKNYNHTTQYYNNFVCCNQYHNFVDENPSHLNFKLRKDSYLRGKFASNVCDRVRGIDGETVKFEVVDFDSIGIIKQRSNI